MDTNTPPTENAFSHQRTSASGPQPCPTTQCQPVSLTDENPPKLTRKIMKVFNKAVDVEAARRRGIALPKGFSDCSSTSSERNARLHEEARLLMTPELDQQLAALDKAVAARNARHGEERAREWKEWQDREAAESKRAWKAAVDEALERIRKVPYHPAPTLGQLNEMPEADIEAWHIRCLEHQHEFDMDAAVAKFLGSQSSSPEDSDNDLHEIAKNNGHYRGDEPAAAVAPHEPDDDDIATWVTSPSRMEGPGSWNSSHEPRVLKQQQSAREQEQMDQLRVEQRQEDQRHDDQRQEKQGQGQQSTRLVHLENSPATSGQRSPVLPDHLPRYSRIDDKNNVNAYLANASYIVSIGGPPSADLKYGVVVFPVGEENTLFAQQPCHVMTPSFVQEVYDAQYNRQVAALDDFQEASHDRTELPRPQSKPKAADDRNLHSLGETYTRQVASMDDSYEASHDGTELLRPQCKPVAADDRNLHSLGKMADPAGAACPDKGRDMPEDSALPRILPYGVHPSHRAAPQVTWVRAGERQMAASM